MLRFSLVTPTLNQGRFLRRTIESVLRQQGPFEIEYRVIDGGSQDETLAILEQYRGQLAYVSEADSGQVEAINKGLALSRGDVVGWLNSDDFLLPAALERVADAFNRHPEAEWVHGRCLIINEADQEIRRWISYYKHQLARRHTLDRLLVENYVSQPTAFWRRNVLDAVGDLEPSIPYAFDYDMWIRLARRGAPVYLEQPLACFRWHEASLGGRDFETQLKQNSAVAARYAGGRRSILLQKKFAIAVTLITYRVMALARRAGAALGRRLARPSRDPSGPRGL